MAGESCSVDPVLARKIQTELLRAFADAGQRPIAEALGLSDTWVSRWKKEDLETCARLLAALGLKVVPARNACFDPEYIAHLRYFAQLGMSEHQPKSLDFEDDAA